jgi:hypothetical protein
MADKKNHDEHLERITNHLAESVLGLSDEAIIAETSEAGADPEPEAEATRLVLLTGVEGIGQCEQALVESWPYRQFQLLGARAVGLSQQLPKLRFISEFATATGEMQGEALEGPCPEAASTRSANRKRLVNDFVRCWFCFSIGILNTMAASF